MQPSGQLTGAQRAALLGTTLCCAVCTALIPWPQERQWMALGGAALITIIWLAMKREVSKSETPSTGAQS